MLQPVQIYFFSFLGADTEYTNPKAVKKTEKQEATDVSKGSINRQERTSQKSRKRPSGSSVSESDESPISKKRRIVSEDNKKHGKSATDVPTEQGKSQSSALPENQKTGEEAGTKKRKRSQGKSKDDADGSQDSPVKSKKKETKPDVRLEADQTQCENGKLAEKKSQEVTDSKLKRKKRKKTGRAKDKDIPELRVLPK